MLILLILLVMVVPDQFTQPHPAADPPTPVPATPSAAILEQGRLNFAAYCEACHGPNAQGLSGLGPNLTTSAFVQRQTNQALVNFVIQGRPVSDPANQSGVAMPARAGFPRLSDEAIRSIIYYIRTLSTEMSR